MLKRDRDYLRESRIGFLASSADGRPTLIPVCFCLSRDVIYTAIDRKPKGKRLARVSNIRSNPRVAFLVHRYSEDWRDLSYLLLHGNARLVVDEAEAAAARTMLTKRYPQYRSLSLDGCAVLAISIRESKFWRFGTRNESGERV
jgi:PPOX class probable F420-dependent enzyme